MSNIGNNVHKVCAVGIGMIKDESDIIEDFVRHNLHFLDAMVILDNGSKDGSRQILQRLMAEGLPLCVVDDYQVAYLQSEKMTELYRRVATSMFPDFILPLDADEFIQANSVEDFQEILYSIPKRSVGLYKWKTYVPHLDSFPRHIGEFKYRRKNGFLERTKVIIRCDGKVDPDLSIDRGNHNVKRRGRVVSSILLEEIWLAHFVVRSVASLYKTYIMKWLGRIKKGCALQLMRESPDVYANYQRIVEGERLSERDVTYTALNFGQPIFTVANNWQDYVCEEPPSLHTTPQKKNLSSEDFGLKLALNLSEEWSAQIEGERGDYWNFELHDYGRVRHSNQARTPSDHGVFDPKAHLQTMYADLPPFKYIFERTQPDSIVDFGCGLGIYLNWFKRLGAQKILGVDGFDLEYSFLETPEEYHKSDLSSPVDLGKRFDLVNCLEVIEHIPEEFSLNLIKTLDLHAKRYILFSAAGVGQGGKGHINCQPLSHWAKIFSSLGWAPLVPESMFVRCVASLSWFRKNLVLLKRAKFVSRDELMRRWHPLIQIAGYNHKWCGDSQTKIFDMLRAKVCVHAYPDHLMAFNYSDKFTCQYSFEKDIVQSAKTLLQEELRKFSGDAHIHYLLGCVYLREGDTQTARLSFEKAVEICPENRNYKKVLLRLLRDTARTELIS